MQERALKGNAPRGIPMGAIPVKTILQGGQTDGVYEGRVET